jgi:periplasmic protein TonB
VFFVAREPELGALFIDLTRGAGGESEAAAVGARDGSRAARAPAPVAVPEPSPAPRAAAASAPAAAPEPSPAPGVVAEEAGDDGAAPRAPAGPGAAAEGEGASPADGTLTAGAGVPGGAELAAAPDAGRALALAAPGGGGAGAPGAEYGPYLARLRQRVQAALRYPAAARRRGLQGTVALEIVIRRDGRLDVVALADSSSHGLLDEAALETVRRLAPEPFPPGVAPRVLRVRLPVVFTLE